MRINTGIMMTCLQSPVVGYHSVRCPSQSINETRVACGYHSGRLDDQARPEYHSGVGTALHGYHSVARRAGQTRVSLGSRDPGVCGYHSAARQPESITPNLGILGTRECVGITRRLDKPDVSQ